MRSDFHITSQLPEVFTLKMQLKRGGGTRIRKMTCEGEIYRVKENSGMYDYLVNYTPVSPMSYYVLHQYFLKKSFAWRVH